ncbi:MAG TPA: Crp/Fnr family transcriptional regulator [Candidatus Sulfotelmatobacter sp.]|jgi:CRP-like cAMP-binding protein|nr:Crp/Fnr family transcriptional regulator [Candidatus Sulfotelmatobacter sp.]
METDALMEGTIIAKRGTRSNKPLALHSGARSDATGKAVSNLILLALPDKEFNLLRPHLESTDLPQHKILQEPGEKIEFAYFLNDGMVSLVALSHDGRSVEVGIVGKEGMIGMCLTEDLHLEIFRAIMQMSGSGMRIRSQVFQDILLSAPGLRSKLGRFALMHGMQVAQLAACNRLHGIDQRLARWLLMCQDRFDSQLLPLTHEFLAQMLGTGRPSVTLAAGMLENAGLIENLRGTVKILNRKSLEAVACECYGVIQNFNGGLGLK